MNVKKKSQQASDRAVIEFSESPSSLSQSFEIDRKKYHKIEGEKHGKSERTIQRLLQRRINPAQSDYRPNDLRIFPSNEESTNLEVVRASDTIRIRSNLDTIESKPSGGTDEYEFSKRRKMHKRTTSDNHNSSRSRPPNSSSYTADSSSQSIGINTPPLIMKGVSGSNDAKIMGIVQRKKKSPQIGSQVMDEYCIVYSTKSSTKDGDGDVMSVCCISLISPQIDHRREENENDAHSHSLSGNTKKNPKLLVRQTSQRLAKEVKDNNNENILSNINI